jgi:hypothetical protein
MLVADDPMWLEGDDHRANTDQVMKEIEALLREAVSTRVRGSGGGRGGRWRR